MLFRSPVSRIYAKRFAACHPLSSPFTASRITTHHLKSLYKPKPVLRAISHTPMQPLDSKHDPRIKAIDLSLGVITEARFPELTAKNLVLIFRQYGIILLEQMIDKSNLNCSSQIQNILQMDYIKTQWLKKYGAYPKYADYEHVLLDFHRELLWDVKNNSLLKKETADIVSFLQAKNFRVIASSPFSREITDAVLHSAQMEYCHFDHSVAAGERSVFQSPLFKFHLGIQQANQMLCIANCSDRLYLEDHRLRGSWTTAVTQPGADAALAHYQVDSLIETLHVIPDIIDRSMKTSALNTALVSTQKTTLSPNVS